MSLMGTPILQDQRNMRAEGLGLIFFYGLIL